MDNDAELLDDNLHDDYAGTEELVLEPRIISYLAETGKWAKFLGILGFIGIGCLVLLSFSIGTIMSMAGGEAVAGLPMLSSTMFLTIVYLMMAALYFFPILYLYNFGNKIQTAIRNEDQAILNEAFMNLKSHYKFIGILAIVLISIYVLGIVFAIFFTAAF